MSHRCRAKAKAIREPRERGATLVEYALILSVLVVGSIGVVNRLSDSADAQVDNQAECVQTRPPPPSCQIPVVSTTTTTMGPGPGPSVTAPSLPPPLSAAYTRTDAFADGAAPAGWYAEIEVEISDAEGAIEGSIVRVRFSTTVPSGGAPPFYVTCTTGADGRCVARFDPPLTTTTQLAVTIDDVIGPGERVPEDLPAAAVVDKP